MSGTVQYYIDKVNNLEEKLSHIAMNMEQVNNNASFKEDKERVMHRALGGLTSVYVKLNNLREELEEELNVENN
jgi:hypothetical protein